MAISDHQHWHKKFQADSAMPGSVKKLTTVEMSVMSEFSDLQRSTRFNEN